MICESSPREAVSSLMARMSLGNCIGRRGAYLGFSTMLTSAAPICVQISSSGGGCACAGGSVMPNATSRIERSVSARTVSASGGVAALSGAGTGSGAAPASAARAASGSAFSAAIWVVESAAALSGDPRRRSSRKPASSARAAADPISHMLIAID